MLDVVHPAAHVNKRGILGIQDSRHSGVLAGTFLKINGVLHWLNTDVVYAFQILELYLPAIDGSLICMAALYKVPARPCFRWAAIEYITIKSFVTIFLIVTKYAILSRLLDCRELRAFPGTFLVRIPGTLNFYRCVVLTLPGSWRWLWMGWIQGTLFLIHLAMDDSCNKSNTCDYDEICLCNGCCRSTTA